MNIVLVGAPLSGKGTQSELIKNKFGLVHISMGDCFREILSKQSPLNQKIKAYLEKGKLVPDKITLEVLKEKLSSISYKNGVLLDGYPRTLNQAQNLDKILKIDAVIFIKLQLNDIINRVEGRYICENCSKIHTIFDKNVKNCSNCGGSLVKRKDDTPQIAQQRFNEFIESTYPLIDYYDKKGLLFTVDGNGSIQEIFEKIENQIKSL